MAWALSKYGNITRLRVKFCHFILKIVFSIKFEENSPNRFYALLDETEPGTACHPIRLNFEHQDESSLQIVVQLQVLDCLSLHSFSNAKKRLFSSFLYETEPGTTCDPIRLNFEHQDGSSLQIVVQLEVLDCLSLHSFSNAKKRLFSSFLYETEPGTACDPIRLNFEHQDGSSLQIVVQLEVLDCLSLHSFSNAKKRLFQVFCMKERLGLHVIKVYSVVLQHP